MSMRRSVRKSAPLATRCRRFYATREKSLAGCGGLVNQAVTRRRSFGDTFRWKAVPGGAYSVFCGKLDFIGNQPPPTKPVQMPAGRRRPVLF